MYNTSTVILHCRNNFVFGESSIRAIEVTALLEYRDLEHLSMTIILGVATTVKKKEGGATSPIALP